MTFPDELHRTKNFLRGYHAPHQEGTPILKISDLKARYDRDWVLEAISFTLNPGQRVAVVGPNGAGKSTLFRVIAGVHAAYQGDVEVFGLNPGGHICIAYLPQRSQVDWNFPATVADVVMMGRTSKIGLLRWPKRRDWDVVRSCLESVGLLSMENTRIGELSGGQQQRMFIARALAQEAELILMDEPFTGLDIQSMEDIFRIFDFMKERAVTVMVSMHDLDLAAERFDQVILLNRRLYGYGEPESVFTTENLQAAYGHQLHLINTEDGKLYLDDTCCDDAPLEIEAGID